MAASLQEEMLQGNTGRILEAVNNAEAIVGRQEVSFPRIAVFGDESSGKSSLLEAICKVPFPRGSNVTTKCPTQVRLQRKPGPWKATAWTAPEESTERRNLRSVSSPEQLTAVISELQALEIALANKRSNTVGTDFSTVPITISIEAEDVVDLTLIDLPGYFERTLLDRTTAAAKKEAEKSDNDVERVKETLIEYLEDESTILLIIVPANANIKNANILKLIENVKDGMTEEELTNLRSRTIYCFTKCDLVGGDRGSSPQDIEQILSNTGSFSAKPHGWYAVINKDGGKPNARDNFAARLKHTREHEMKHFQNNSPYNKPHLRERCGTENLIHALAGLLSQEISKNIPNMLSESSLALSKAKKELKGLGVPPSQIRNVHIEFDRVISDMRDYYRKATNGWYQPLIVEAGDKAPDIGTEELEKYKLGKKKEILFQQFQNDILGQSLDLDDDNVLQELGKRVAEGTDGRMAGVLPMQEVLYDEIRACVKKWRALSEAMCEDVAEAAITCLNVIIDVKAGKYERLPALLRDYFGKMINEQKLKAQNRLQWQYVGEIARPTSRTEDFMTRYAAQQNMQGLGPSVEQNRDTFVKILKAYLPVAESRYIDTAVITVSTHILDVPLGDAIHRVDFEGEPEFVFLANSIKGDLNTEDLMKVRDDLSVKRTAVEEKVKELEKLREALYMQPGINRNPDIAPNGAAIGNGNGHSSSSGKH